MIALSVVMPCYRRAADLAVVLPHNARYLGRPDVQLVLVLDDPGDEAEVLALVDQLPLVRARVIVNDVPHPWRSPAKAVNVGIRAATGAAILVCSPESAFVSDVPAQVIEGLRRFPGQVLIGQVAWATFAEAATEPVEPLFARARRRSRRQSAAEHFYGSIAAPRALFEAVRGYDESIAGWGGEDDNIRLRMALAGAKLVVDPDIALLHLAEDGRANENRTAPRNDDATLEALLNPAAAAANPDGWGADFGRRARDWIAGEAKPRIARGTTSRGAGRPPRVVALFSFRYDAALVPDLLANLDPIVDGWIGYDDRAGAGLFSDEPQRRRLLIREAAAAGARWILAVDPDERFEATLATRIDTLTAGDERLVWAFHFREMYAADAYRVDGRWGEKAQGRLFPIAGDLRIGAAPLHGPWCAGWRTVHSGLNIYHLKMISAERRRARRALNRHLDPDGLCQPQGYDYLAEDTGARLEPIPPGRGYTPPHHDDGALWMGRLP